MEVLRVSSEMQKDEIVKDGMTWEKMTTSCRATMNSL